jgi:site-specific DNA recombinase
MKAIIYLRTSTAEQFPEKQKADCLRFAESRGYEIVDVFQEQLSGYKDIVRPRYEEVKARAYKGEIQAVIVWALDRWVRNKDTLLEDVTTLRSYGCKLHSVNEQWLESINVEGPLGKTIQDFLLGIVGSLAQIESQRKSERTTMAFKNKTGRWGRKGLPNVTKQKIIDLYKQGVSLRAITQQVTYYDKNKHPKNVSLGAVHKIISDLTTTNNTQEDISQLSE